MEKGIRHKAGGIRRKGEGVGCKEEGGRYVAKGIRYKGEGLGCKEEGGRGKMDSSNNGRHSQSLPTSREEDVWGEAKKRNKHTAGLGKLVVAMAFCILISVTGYAQQLSAKLDRDKIVLGEQVTLELKLEGLDANADFITNWFNLPDTINHIQVIKRDTIDTVEVNGLTTYLQHITITSFDSGRWAIPLQKLVLQNKTSGKQIPIKTDSVFLQVLPVDVSGLRDYHDIKDIIDVPVEADYTLLIAGIVSAIVIIVLVILLLKRKKRPAKPVGAPAPKLNALDEALQRIDTLRQEDLPAKGHAKLFYTKLDDIWRGYFSDRANIQSRQSTSDELMMRLGVYLQDKDMKTTFYQLLRLADAAKFAKYQPDAQQNEEALQQAATCLRHIEKQIQIANGHII